jgi:mono/diheme cytochrome c family protein
MTRIITTLLVIGLIASQAYAEKADFFAAQIAPIFERHCVSCHSGGEPKGGLDLTTRPKALAGGESGDLLALGKPDDSLLVEHISGDDPQMPKDAPPLSAEQVAAVRQWIAEGATWPDELVLTDKKAIDGNWWSLLPRQTISVPSLDDAWIRTPVDAFILAKLREQKLSPNTESDRPTLIRRLTYDLHGLPPTPEEIDVFVSDTSGDAYRNLVDRLLASPRYGERWGRHWLDIVHFGESHGYDKDKPRPNAWPYRDYVIRSFNDDKPYDRFVAEQIAGDILDPANPDATVATGFIAAGPWDFVGHVELREGTTDKEIARSNDRDDMLANTMSTFVSLTVHCARCHNHKFDPIRQADYYALQAVFAGVDRGDRKYDADPQVASHRAELAAEQTKLTEQLGEIRKRVAATTSPNIAALDAQIATWNTEVAAIGAAERSQTLGYHSQIMPKDDVPKWVQVDLGESRAIDEIVLVPAHEVYGGHPGPGFGFPPRYKVEVSDDPQFAVSHTIADNTSADMPHPGDRWQNLSAAGTSGRYVRVTAARLWQRTNDWIFALGELIVLSGGQNVAIDKPVSALDSIEAAPSWAQRNLVDGFSSRERVTTAEGLMPRRRELEKLLQQAAVQRTELVLKQLDVATRTQFAALEARLPEIERELAALPEQQKFYAGTSGFEPRPIHLLARGDVKSPQELIAPGAVACVQGPAASFDIADPSDERQRRAALANWLVDPRNALLRRSIVNRVWQYHFGAGLVDSPNDFGRMGSLPTHPELLEWLAGWFADQGHSLKELHRLLVMSSVYRQSSRSDEAFEKIDAGNRYLWRMNRTRLDAECVRDAMLYVSGKLDLSMGGPSVQQFVFKDDHSPIYDYANFDVDDPRGLRRSVYRFLVRSVPDPFMDSLDCADPSIMTPRRNTTLTAIQALAVLNNPLVVRQAEHFANRVTTITSEPSQQIATVYRLALGRAPSEAETTALLGYVTKFGLANACRVILNSNEFMFVD